MLKLTEVQKDTLSIEDMKTALYYYRQGDNDVLKYLNENSLFTPQELSVTKFYKLEG